MKLRSGQAENTGEAGDAEFRVSAYELADNDRCCRCVRSFTLHMECSRQTFGEQADSQGED